MKIKFSKMNGLGNDFVVINNLHLGLHLSSKQIQYLSDRKFGVGCDQVLLIGQPSDNSSDFFYHIYNSDGSIAGQCGNGARCFIKFLYDNSLTDKVTVRLQTETRKIEGWQSDHGLIEVNLGKPDFSPANIPLVAEQANSYYYNLDGETIEFAAVSMGNPHAVILMQSQDMLADDSYLCKVGYELQNCYLFPESVNVNFMFVESRDRIILRTFERGSGLTLACGSGACAAASIAIRDGLVDNTVKVQMQGGTLQIFWQGDDLYMKGEASHVYDGEIEL